jgi:hypothetical protein
MDMRAERAGNEDSGYAIAESAISGDGDGRADSPSGRRLGKLNV